MKTQTKQLKHEKGLTSFAPLMEITPEMSVCYREFVRQNPQYASGTRKEIFDRFYEWYDQLETKRRIWIDNIHSGADKYRDEHMHPRVKDKIESMGDGRRILDVGCGTGEAVIPYLKESQYYLGLDSSRICLEEAAQLHSLEIADDSGNYGNRKMLRFGALPNAIPFKQEEYFDEAIASMVLHHVKDYKGALDSIMNLLHPRGNYFIVTFDSDKREQIESAFEKIKQREGTKTVGDFNLPSGRLEDETIYFHDNEDVHRHLRKYSDFIHCEENGGIFQIFEGIKKRK